MTAAESNSKMLASLTSMKTSLKTIQDEITGNDADYTEVLGDVGTAVDGETDPLSSAGFHEIMKDLVSDDDTTNALTIEQTDAIRVVALDYAGISDGTSFDSLTPVQKDNFKQALAMLASGYNGDDNALSFAEFGILGQEAIVAVNNAKGISTTTGTPVSTGTPIDV